jgi:hypothetical protein
MLESRSKKILAFELFWLGEEERERESKKREKALSSPNNL